MVGEIRVERPKKCQCFMETCTGDLAKSYTSKAYQEKEERYTMKNENQCIL
jgi:hypothetical protein